MKVTTNLEKLIFGLITYYHVIYLGMAVFIPVLNNRLAILMLFLIFIYFNKKIALKNTVVFIIVDFSFILYTVYTAVKYHLYQVTHSDYYSFYLLIFCFLTFANCEIRLRFKRYFLQHKKKFLVATVIYFLLLLYSIAFQDGLHTGFGSIIPVLYGPYSVPHILSYSLVGVYCALAILYKTDKNKWIVGLKALSVICTVWTAARSGVLAIAIVVMVDFLMTRSASKKLIIASLSGCVILYLALFTDILVENPLIQKTLSAISEGSITNGRERFIEILMNYYKYSTTPIEKTLGIGMNNVRNVMLNDPTINVGIHAHNDYVNAICGFGILGLVTLVVSQIKLLAVCKKTLYKILLEVFISLFCYYNGLAMYTVFTPMLIIVFCFFEMTNDILESSK